MKKLNHLKRTSILLLLLINAGSIITIHAQDGGWEQMKSMNLARGSSASCVMDSLIYVFGGIDKSSQLMNSAEVYNTETNEWSDLASVPMEFTGYSVAGSINKKIYLVGGYHGTGWLPINSTFEYDPGTDSWDMKNECPKKTADHTICVLDEKLYLFGGLKDWPERDTSGQEDAFVYDPATDTWDSIPDMLYKRAVGATACAYDGQIYVFGGFMFASLYDGTTKGTFLVRKTEKYDPLEKTWTELADMPVPVAAHVSLVYNDKIYVFGGDSLFSRPKTVCTSIIQEYDPLTNQWQIMENMPFNRGAMIGQKMDSFAYIIGGYPKDERIYYSALSEVWRFNLDSLKVWEPRCGEVRVSVSELELEVDSTILISPLVLPTYLPDRSVSWASSNEEVATVSFEGVVTGVSLGKATITVTAVSGGCSDSLLVTVTDVTGIPDHLADQIVLYPNPSGDVINIDIENVNNATIEIYNVSGNLIFSKALNSKFAKIDISGLPNGIYIVKVMQDGAINVGKVVVR